MIKLLLTLLLSLLLNLMNIITTPINALIQTYFPDIENYVLIILGTFDTYVFPIFGFFADLLPTPVWTGLVLYLNTYLIINWFFEPAYKVIVRALYVIKKLPLA